MNERLLDYLLGDLDPDERAAFEASPTRMAEAERLRPLLTRLGSLTREEWDPPEAPALALSRTPEPAPRRRRVLSLRPMVATGLAVVLLAIGVGAGVLLGGRDAGGGTARGRLLVLEPVEPAGGSAHGSVVLARDGRARFTLRGLQPSTDGNFYELWLMNSADDLVSLGSFRVPASGEADFTVPLPADPDGFAAVDVSAEPDDGDPAHSTRSVLRAPLKTG